MVRLTNRFGRYCWDNACVFGVIYAWKECFIPMPDETDSSDSESSYFKEFKSWLLLDYPGERNPKKALTLFTQEFQPPGSVDVGNATQDASLFFEAMNGDLDPYNPVEEFQWMQPIAQERFSINRYRCHGGGPRGLDPSPPQILKFWLIPPWKYEVGVKCPSLPKKNPPSQWNKFSSILVKISNLCALMRL